VTRPDLLVIGGGVVGLTVALELRRRHPGARVVLLEKEDGCGRHASGRNSGVLHAGFYYSPDSLKARFCRDGCRELTELCAARGLPLLRCGKLVVSRGPADLPTLDELVRRARAGGIELVEVTADEARRIEPRARTHERALFSPTTASVDPVRVMATLMALAEQAGVEVRSGEAFIGLQGGIVVTTRDRLQPGYVVSAAGLHADRVARAFGFGRDHAILPFRGLYLQGDVPGDFVRVHVYPAPDIRNPFVGVHFTRTAAGAVKIGPTALPALWREQYAGLSGFSAAELGAIAWRQAGLLLSAGFDFRQLAADELRKASRREVIARAAALVDGMDPAAWRRWAAPGIRAQLLHLPTRRLEMDFRLEGDARSLHVLNAVSPAFTCCLPFARHVADEVERLHGGGAPPDRAARA
jgi:L-2-hydroxyglutarate oxidase LhgO